MKRTCLFLISLCFLSLESIAQSLESTITIPNSSFENWSNGNGYNVTALFIPLSVYSDYSYPTGWDYPTYPINDDVTYIGVNIHVNTDIPLLKVSNETSSTIEGTHALKLQNFKLSDILSTTAYNLAPSLVDPELTTMVFPTVLSTGMVNIEQFLQIMPEFFSNFGSLPQLLSTFDGMDINTLIDGGLPLNGAIPGRMTGYYKYSSAIGGDNGSILLIGTKYNPTSRQREVVGAGYTRSLTDTPFFTPFELVYTPLSEIDPSESYIEADSLIILLFSSANASPQQGSALYLDNLQLWTKEEIIDDDTTGIQPFMVEKMVVFPNPACGQCEVRFTQEIPKNIRLYSIDGALLQQISPNEEKIELNLPSKGVFILSCEMKDGIVTRRIVNQ